MFQETHKRQSSSLVKCFLCGNTATRKHRLICSKSEKFKDNVLKTCEERTKDIWADEVRSRLESSQVGGESFFYHNACWVNFRHKDRYGVPKAFAFKETCSSENVNHTSNKKLSKKSAIFEVFKYLESVRVASVKELCNILNKELSQSGCEKEYTVKWTKTLLKEHSTTIHFIESQGLPDLCLFKKDIDHVIRAHHDCRNNNPENDIKVVERAAIIISREVQSIPECGHFYPDAEDIIKPNHYVVEPLRFLLSKIISSNDNLKVAAIARQSLNAPVQRIS